MTTGIDITLVLHAVSLFALAWLISRAAWQRHGRRIFRLPPVALVAWAFSEGMDGAVYLRRWLSQMFGWDAVDYSGLLSMVLNGLSLFAIWLLIYMLVDEGKKD